MMPDTEGMRRRKKLIHIDFDWENAPSFKQTHPDDDPLMQPLFGGILQSKFVAPASVLVSVFVSLIVWNNYIVGTTPETEAYFFALDNRAANVCIGETEYVGDTYAVVPLVWESVTGEIAAASIQLERSDAAVNVGDHWQLDEVAYSSTGNCDDGQWRQTVWNTGLKGTPTVPSQAVPSSPASEQDPTPTPTDPPVGDTPVNSLTGL